MAIELQKSFNPNEYLMKVGSGKYAKDYLPVQWRLVWFRGMATKGTITTSVVHLDTEKGIAVFKAIIEDGDGGHAEGHGSESIQDFRDYIEKAETKAIGRALAALGYGTQFTGDELDEAHRIVDSPVDKSGQEQQDAPKSRPNEPQKPTPVPNNSPATDQQKSGIKRLCGLMNKESTLASDATFDQAGRMLKQLSDEYKKFGKAS